MKKILATLVFTGSVMGASAQKGFKYGVTFGLGGNNSNYSGGTADANALFYHNDFGKANLGFTARYFFDDHWSVQSGLGISEIGFEFALAKDYSLLKKDDHFTKNNMGITVMQVPITAIYAFKPNCKNIRWFVGAGISSMTNFSNVNQTTHVTPKAGDIANNTDYLDQTINAEKFTVINGQLMGGIEKIFKKGSILQLALITNLGFSNIATSSVTYQVDNIKYSHTFSNKGDYSGLTLTYYFKSIGEK
jgi:hypothetical protein